MQAAKLHDLVDQCHNPRFLAIIGEVLAMHNRKSADYASTEDPLQNVRTAGEYGLEPWIGVQLRLDDKRNRIKGAIRKMLSGKPVTMANEALRDSFVDRIVYAIIALQLYDETPSGTHSSPILGGATNTVAKCNCENCKAGEDDNCKIVECNQAMR